MALFTSIQTGDWSDGDTWDQAGAVPDGTSDVLVDADHVVTVASGDETIGDTHTLTIAVAATLEVNGTLTVTEGGSEYALGTIVVSGDVAVLTVDGALYVDGGTLSTADTAALNISETGTLIVENGGTLSLGAGTTMDIDGLLSILAAGEADFSGAITIDIAGCFSMSGEGATAVLQSVGSIDCAGTIFVDMGASFQAFRKLSLSDSSVLIVEGATAFVISTSFLIDLADAIVDSLNGHTFYPPFTAVRGYVPTFKLSDMRDLRVTVVPKSLTTQRISRGETRYDIEVDVGIQQRFRPDDTNTLDTLMSLTQAVLEFLYGVRKLDVWSIVGVANDPIYSVGHYKELGQFTSVLTVSAVGVAA